MAVVVAKNNAGEYYFMDNITDQEMEDINKANQTASQCNAQGKHNTKNDDEQSNSYGNGDITGAKENNSESAKTKTPADSKIDKETALKIKKMLNSWMPEICTETEYNLLRLMEDELQKEMENESIDTEEDSFYEPTDDGTTIYTNMRQLIEYYSNRSEGNDSSSSALMVSRCTYWDNYTQDVMLHNEDETSKGSST